jgi:hypothetical protein
MIDGMFDIVPLFAAALVSCMCAVYAVRYRCFTGRYLLMLAVSLVYAIMQVDWIVDASWVPLDAAGQEVKKFVWGTLEMFWWLAVLMIAHIPREAGFR